MQIHIDTFFILHIIYITYNLYTSATFNKIETISIH